MPDALASLWAIIGGRPTASARIAPRDLPAEPLRLDGSLAATLRWIPLAMALLVGCGGTGTTTTLAPAENPPTTPQERIQKNPKMKADFEANSRKAR